MARSQTPTPEPHWSEGVSTPALLRAARRTYQRAIRQALIECGADDLPANGPYVLGAVVNAGAPLSEIVEQLGVSKQAAGQLIDTLVTRGFLERSVDPSDRRRLTITFTERGRHTADVVRDAIVDVDTRLLARTGPADIATTRATLGALAELG